MTGPRTLPERRDCVPPRQARWRWPLLLLWAAGMLGGCGLLSSAPKPVTPGWPALTVAATPDANANSAVAVDLVLVTDKAMLENLAALPASRYFATRPELLRTFPNGFKVLALEITPGQQVTFARAALNGAPVWAALVFANYASPGEHRLRLELGANEYLLQLGAQEFVAIDRTTGLAR